MIRDKHIPINGWLLSQLRLVAELHGIDCPETLVEAWLRERLESMPEMAELATALSKSKKETIAAWKERRKPSSNPLEETL